jgi:hypothetical protein
MFMLGYGTSRYVFESFQGNAIPEVLFTVDRRWGVNQADATSLPENVRRSARAWVDSIHNVLRRKPIGTRRHVRGTGLLPQSDQAARLMV